jgi:UDP-N-acetylmuramate: L-alanyl-gamma-D-glutamyl-meso-diaminopimelate ligase
MQTQTTTSNGRPVHYHFSGICGTAMASLAVLLQRRGCRITGSDERFYPPMSDFLTENGIAVTTPYQVENLVPHPDYVVLGNALSRGNPEVEYALKAHLHYLSMAELLKDTFIRGNRSIVITGTHGKTTTTALAAHVLTSCGRPTGFMVGGLPENYGSSCRDVIPGGYFVVEGDEYDTSLFDKRSKFFHYLPDVVIINNIEFDHADIFRSLDDIKTAFSLMLRQVPADGLIIVNGDDPEAMKVAKTGFSPILSFGFGQDCDAVIDGCDFDLGHEGITWRLTFEGRSYGLRLPLFGTYNVRNATAVVLMALREGLTVEAIQTGLSTFKNVKRRLQLLTKNPHIRVFDDFAHHPTAIRETIGALRHAWPAATIHAVYEARSNTSVRRFHQQRMADCFADADTVTFYKLHREERIAPEERLDIPKIVLELKALGKSARLETDLEQMIRNASERARSGDIFVFMSNGAFGGIQHRTAALIDDTWNR